MNDCPVAKDGCQESATSGETDGKAVQEGKPRQSPLTDYDQGPEPLGHGSFGNVYEVTNKETQI